MITAEHIEKRDAAVAATLGARRAVEDFLELERGDNLVNAPVLATVGSLRNVVADLNRLAENLKEVYG